MGVIKIEGLLSRIIGVAVGIMLIALLIPMGLVMLASANLTGVDATVAQVLTVALPVVAIISLLIYFVKGLIE